MPWKLVGIVALGIALAALCGCAKAQGTYAQAQRLDRRFGTHVYTWLLDHDPSNLDVSGTAPADAAPFVRNGHVRSVAPDVTLACRQARADHALLLAFAAERDRPARDAVRDCGIPLERDATALIVAPEYALTR